MALEESLLTRTVRVGTVSSVDNAKHEATVWFPDMAFLSGPLKVLDNRPFIPGYDVPQETDSRSGGAGDPAFEAHTHPLTINQWMPKVGQTVVCLYVPTHNGDGFVLGGVDGG